MPAHRPETATPGRRHPLRNIESPAATSRWLVYPLAPAQLSHRKPFRRNGFLQSNRTYFDNPTRVWYAPVIRNIIFDWSGTLVDDLPGVWKATNHVLEQAGAPTLTLDEFRSDFELPFTNFYDRHIPDVPLEQLEKWFHSCFSKVSGDVLALPHAVNFLEFCREKEICCFVLSTVNPEYFATQIANAKMEGFFDHTYLGIWDKRKKINEILDENELARDQTVYVGDMQHDVETAHHGGIQSAALLTGYNTLEQLQQSNPTFIAANLADLQRTLETNSLELREDSPARSPIATVGALIYNALGQVLMIRTEKWSGKWGIPGGKIEYGESYEKALRREIIEETNLQIRDIEFVLVQDSIESDEFFRPEHFILLNYICHNIYASLFKTTKFFNSFFISSRKC